MRLLRTVLAILSFAVFAAPVFVEPAGYLFVTFGGGHGPLGEQIYFASSRDGREWTTLNNGDPVLVTDIGTKGARDPFLLRSQDGKEYFVIATDLSMHFLGNWGLRDPLLVTTDGAGGLIRAVEEVLLPASVSVAWPTRCASSRARCPTRSGPSSGPRQPPGTRPRRRPMARLLCDDVVKRYGKTLSGPTGCFRDDVASGSRLYRTPALPAGTTYIRTGHAGAEDHASSFSRSSRVSCCRRLDCWPPTMASARRFFLACSSAMRCSTVLSQIKR